MAVVARFRDLAEAEVASATLEAAGIVNSLADTYYLGLVWTASTALRWIRLNVRDVDLEEARDLLALTADTDWPVEPEQANAEKCVACGSVDLTLKSGPRKTMALMLITYIPLWFWRSRVECRGCGASWRVPLRFRPDLLIVWLTAALIVWFLLALTLMISGFVIYGRRRA